MSVFTNLLNQGVDVVKQGADTLQSSATNFGKMFGGASTVSSLVQKLDQCKNVAVKTYNQLSDADRQHMDALVLGALRFVQTIRPQLPVIMGYISAMDTNSYVSILKIATKMLRKKRTAKLIQEYLDMYADLVKNPRRLKAYGKYMACLLSNVDAKYKEAVVSTIEFGFAFLQTVSHTDLKVQVLDLSKSVRKYILRPLHKELNSA